MSRPTARRRLRVVHVVDSVTPSGASRALLATARGSARRLPVEHCIAHLRSVGPEGRGLAARFGVRLLDGAGGTMSAELASADVVVVHYYNHPKLVEFLAYTCASIPMRLLIWFHVAGSHPPHLITPELLRVADLAVACNEFTWRLPAFATLPASAKEYVFAPTDAERASRLLRLSRPSSGPPVSAYAGTIDFTKMHPEYVDMHADANVPGLRLMLAGTAEPGHSARKWLEHRATARGMAARLSFLGRVPEVDSLLSSATVYGYPIIEPSYAGSELNIQEAMFAGMAPVILDHGATPSLMRSGESGLVARDSAEFAACIARLSADPDLRRDMGAAARAFATEHFRESDSGAAMARAYERLMSKPKRTRQWPGTSGGAPGHRGRRLYAASVGTDLAERTLAAADGDAQALTELRRLYEAQPILRSPGHGSVRHYARFFPTDRLLARCVAAVERL
jgi:glycosyltransferase involved in cell wall biosynthesis